MNFAPVAKCCARSKFLRRALEFLRHALEFLRRALVLTLPFSILLQVALLSFLLTLVVIFLRILLFVSF